MTKIDEDRLTGHLGQTYGIDVVGLGALDVGVFRVDRGDGGAWVARVFPAACPSEVVQGDAAILRGLERAGFPAERCAHAEPVSMLAEQPVLVTDFVEPAAPLRPGRHAAILGTLLGRLHSNPATGMREGGAWHHLSFAGTPQAEVAAAGELLEDASSRVGLRELTLYDRLRDEVEATDDCRDLPHAFVHPDLVPANAIPTADEHLVIVDWAGAGRGPRLWSLGFLLWAAGARSPRLVDAVVSRYGRHISLEPEELARLGGAVRARPVMLECWSFCAGRRNLADAIQRIGHANKLAEEIADHARRAFKGTGPR